MSIFKTKKSWGLTGLLVMVMAGLIYAQGSVPYSTGFDTTDSPAFAAGNLNGQNGWTVTSGSANVQATTFQGGDQAVMLDADSEVRKSFSSTSGISKVWVDAYFRGSGSTATPNYPSDPKASAIVHFSKTNGIQCFNGDGAGNYAAVNTGVSLVETNWYRVSIKQDYAAHTWNCYIDGVKKNTNALGFLWNDVSSFNGFINFSGEPSYLDTFRVLSAGAGDANGDGKIDIADVVKCVNLMSDAGADFLLKLNVDTNEDGTISNDELQAVVDALL